jgi:hypothetical protein
MLLYTELEEVNMPITYEPIATQTLGSASIGIEFTSIPSTYTDIVAIVNIKGNNASSEAGHCRINGSSSSIYGNYTFGQTGGTLNNLKQTTGTAIRVYGSDVNNLNDFAPIIYHFFNYASTNVYKTVLSETRGNNGHYMTCHTWRSTDAITSLYFATEGFATVGFVAGTSATLYGIKAA